MGGGYWDKAEYTSRSLLRAASARTKGIKADDEDFAYSVKARQDRSVTVHPNLDPLRINSKPFGKLESRDSADHPSSNPVFIGFDVTGSNFENAVKAQKRLPNLMTLLSKYLPDPQVLVAANDDYQFVGRRAAQISDFESDIRIDDHIRNVILVGQGGGNMGESYDLLLYCAARKTVLDSMEKRNRKGYLFLYADEPFFKKVRKDEVLAIFGDKLQADIPIADIIEETRKLYNVFIIWPQGGYLEARKQYEKLFGEKSVLTLQDPNLICELVGSVVGINEEMIADTGSLEKDLQEAGADTGTVASIVTSVKRKFRLPDTAATA